MPNPYQVRLKVQLNQLSPYLNRLGASLRGAGKRNVLGAIGYQFWKISRENLGSHGSHGSHRPSEWRELSKNYIKWLQKHFPQGPFIPTLLRTGTLLNSIQLTVGNDVAEVWTDCAYAGVHQFGYGPMNIPARPYFPISKEGELTAYAQQKMLAAGNAAMDIVVRTP